MGDFNINEDHKKHPYYEELDNAMASSGVTRLRYLNIKQKTFIWSMGTGTPDHIWTRNIIVLR
jgi:hypothetical protein